MDHFGPFWSCEYQDPVRNKVILTKMVVLTILDHFGPVHFPTVQPPLPMKISISLENFNLAWNFQILTLRIPHKNRGLVGGSLEIFNLAWKCRSFQSRLKISISCSNPEFLSRFGPSGENMVSERDSFKHQTQWGLTCWVVKRFRARGFFECRLLVPCLSPTPPHQPRSTCSVYPTCFLELGQRTTPKGGHRWVPNPPVANPGVAEKAPWWSSQTPLVAGVCSLLEIPTDSCHFPCTSDTLVKSQLSHARKTLSATQKVILICGVQNYYLR